MFCLQMHDVSTRVADADSPLCCCKIVSHVQFDRHLSAEVSVAREDRTLSDGFQKAGLAGTAATNYNDTRQLEALLQLSLQSALLQVLVKSSIGAVAQLIHDRELVEQLRGLSRDRSASEA